MLIVYIISLFIKASKCIVQFARWGVAMLHSPSILSFLVKAGSACSGCVSPDGVLSWFTAQACKGRT